MKIKAFWDDGGEGVLADDAQLVDLRSAQLIWSDTIRGLNGNFLGLIDAEDRTVQFLFAEDIPDEIEDATHLPIIMLDLPQADQGGSFWRMVTVGEVHGLIETAFLYGANPEHFGALEFVEW